MTTEKWIFDVKEDTENESLDQEINSTLEYIEVMKELTEGTGIDIDIKSKLSNVVSKAKFSGNQTLLNKAYDKIIEHHINSKNEYSTGYSAIKAGRIEQTESLIRDLIDKKEFAKALDLAKKISEDKYRFYEQEIKNRVRSEDQQRLARILADEENKFGMGYIVRSPHPEFQGIYYLRKNDTLGRNYEIMPGVVYSGIAVKKDVLELVKYYKNPDVPRNIEVLKRLYLINEEFKKKNQSFIKYLPFEDIMDNIDGMISIVGINHKTQFMLITEPVIRCIKASKSF